jgi:ComF family protein
VKKLAFTPRKISRQTIGSLTGFATCEYNANVAKLIHEFKEGHQTSVAKVMTPAMSEAIGHFESDNILLAPIPSKRESFSTRGFEPASVLAKALARQVAKDRNELLRVERLLSFSQMVSDQASLSGQDRRTNLIGSMVAKAPRKNQSGGNPRVILVDDIVTTGSTIAEGYRCLGAIGVEVVGFVAFAETLPKNLQKRHEKFV